MTDRLSIRSVVLTLALLSVVTAQAEAAPATVAASQPAPVVTIAQGSLRGALEQGLMVYRGIPFAAPPVGELRWRAPQPAPVWRGVRDATRLGPVCPQLLREGYSLETLGGRPMSEDCLHLNVWTADVSAGARRPVMVWILPGGFTVGDAGMERYDGRVLATQGVVVVTFNYRLGMFGTFAHPALSRAQPDEPLGNYNLMDQIAALKWVRANIAAFGGDPANVTIFGMSAGGMSVNYLMTSPASAGLFDKAISESSAVRMLTERHLNREQPKLPSLETEGHTIAGRLSVDGDDPGVVQRLRALTMQQVLDYQTRHRLGVGGGLGPVIDGQILTRPVGEAFRAGAQHRVPYLTGATSWESSLVAKGAPAAPVLDAINVTREQADAIYHERDDTTLNNKIYGEFFLSTQRYLAKQHARVGSPSYVYLFSRVLDQHVGDFFGAAHGATTRYVFGTLDGAALLEGPERPGRFGYRIVDSDRRYADLVRSYWVQFARTGDPNGEGLPGWPAVSQGNDLLLEFAQHGPVLRRDYHLAPWQFFEAHFEAGRL